MTSANKTIALIGIDGHNGPSAELKKEVYARMQRHTLRQVRLWDVAPLQTSLVTNGTAWCGHIGTRLFLQDRVSALHLHFPAKWNMEQGRFDDTSQNGREANMLHAVFGERMQCDTIKELARAIGEGATYTEHETAQESNESIAECADLMLAYTWGGGIFPRDNGLFPLEQNRTHRTWCANKSQFKVHVPLDYMLSDEQFAKAPKMRKRIDGGRSRRINTGMLSVVQGDLLDLPGDVRGRVDAIVHQINCVSTKAGGLALNLFNKYPWADMYTERTPPLTDALKNLGTIDIRFPPSHSANENENTNANENEDAHIADIFTQTTTAAAEKRKEKRKRTESLAQIPPVVGFYAQCLPGKPQPSQNVYKRDPSKAKGTLAGDLDGMGGDTRENRRKWFGECLTKLARFLSKQSKHSCVAFPFGIGCGLAGGNWKIYWSLIEEWAYKHKIHAIIVRLKSA